MATPSPVHPRHFTPLHNRSARQEEEAEQNGESAEQRQEAEIDDDTQMDDAGLRDPSRYTRRWVPRPPRRQWAPDQITALETGMRQFIGWGRWRDIRQKYNRTLAMWTPVDLKDKARNERKRRERMGEPLGVFATVSG
ncbi:hypothetical protein BDK51DRAFT_33017 [Blyttiomyces helicus]|uniref:Myb-like domain-containing protein n=1 Tax=Blyttiomyces helicus TaxID=388810 RepID=A0A4P9VXD4_9FUNG|nr:hypothetical protein BDK51DRAFT_33017 [Blyttiomyces helicus]|eukprot:RKO84379.1 hypothetical protein BDK51DRAFT_33017 [Blyttiomyces helicus]